MASRLEANQMALRVLREFHPGQTIALGTGLPNTLCGVAVPDSGLRFLAESGVLGYECSSQGHSTAWLSAPECSPGGAAYTTHFLPWPERSMHPSSWRYKQMLLIKEINGF